jgi:hypothetical protein
MAEKAKEVPSFTKPVGKPGDERHESAYKKGSPTRVHPHHNEGYSKVGSGCKEGIPTCVPKKVAEREHPFKNQGYKGVGNNPKTGAPGDARKFTPKKAR